MEKQKLQKFELKMGCSSSSSLLRQRSNSFAYQLKHELNSSEKLLELQNKYIVYLHYNDQDHNK